MEHRVKTFPSTVDATVDASAFVMEATQEFGVGESVQEAVLLVIGEAVANAVHHGNQLDPQKDVVVACSKKDGELRICVEDTGAGVPDERLENASLPDDPLQTSGRGLFIMRSLAERIWLENSGRRLCVMWHVATDSEES